MYNFSNISRAVFAIGRASGRGVNLLGTAFALNKPGYLATAAHVIGDDDRNLVLAWKQLESVNDYQDTTDLSITPVPAKVEAVDPFRDLAVLKVDGDIRARLSIAGADDTLVGGQVSIFGYPHADFGRMVLTQQDTEVGAKVLIASNQIKSKHLILNTQARPGQSGSPIFRRDNGTLIAMLVGSYAPNRGESISLGGIDPHTLHQTTHAISTEYLAKMY